MTKQQRIKKLWETMTPENRLVALDGIKKAYPNIKSDTSIRQNWVYKEFPKSKQDEVLKIFKSVVSKQLKEISELIK